LNIFILDEDVQRCARYHCDQHVVKMILESAQLLCTALNKKGFSTPYRSTHSKHPCVLWTEESYSNFKWLSRLALALNEEYRYRYGPESDHKSIEVVTAVQVFEFDDVGLTPFAQAMPDEYKVPGNAVAAYRNFYIGEKLTFATWTRRRKPAWVRDRS
jgi:hypothetical protein